MGGAAEDDSGAIASKRCRTVVREGMNMPVKFIDGSIGGPFTGSMLRSILGDVLKQPQTKPGPAELDNLAFHLNHIRSVFTFAKKVANDSKPAADRVNKALQILIGFFEDRR